VVAGRRLAALVGALLLALSACQRTPGPGAARPTPPDPRIRGTLISDAGEGEGVLFQELPAGHAKPIALPAAVEFVPLGATVGEDVVVLGFGRHSGAMYRVSPGGEVRTLLRHLDEVNSFAVAGDVVAVGDCSRSRVLIVDAGGGTVREAGEGCLGTLSPDGTELAWVRGGAVYRGPVDGSRPPRRWFAFSDVRGLSGLVPNRGRRAFDLSWGTPGIAVVVGNDLDTGLGVIVATERGKLHLIDAIGSGFLSFLRWQPGGRLLGMANGQTGGEGFLRVYDPADGALRTLAMHPRGFASAAWAPDGQTVVAVSGTGFFGSGPIGYRFFLDLQGRQIGSVKGAGASVYGWLP
jgi:hypothetical protein